MPPRKKKAQTLDELLVSKIKDIDSSSIPAEKYRGDPVGFAREVLGIELWDKQVQILEAFKSSKRVSVKSGHKCGKSTVAVVLALWFYCCFEDARVIFTSSTARQVEAILWRELTKLYQRARIKILGDLKQRPSSGLVSPDLREIKGYTARDAESMAGISGKNILYILDEASGIEDRIYEAIEGNRAAGAYILLISNPTRTQGEFYLSHTKKRQFYKTFTISSEDVPNVKQGREVIPGLASLEWIEEKKREWGEDSPIYQVRIKGNFPDGDTNTVIPVGLIEDAVTRREEVDLSLPLYKGTLEVGVDVARFGDDESVICLVRGHHMIAMEHLSGARTDEIVGKIARLVGQHRTRRDPTPVVKIDASGGWGSGVSDALYRRPGEYRVIEYQASQKAYNHREFPLLRDELWFTLARWLREGGTLIDDDKLAGDLACPMYSLDEKGRRKVESKKEIKKRLGRSPDRADALALAVYSEQRTFESDDDTYAEEFEFNYTEIQPYGREISPYGR